MKRCWIECLAAGIGWALVTGFGASSVCGQAADRTASPYRSPLAIAVSPDGKTAYVSDQTARNLTVLDLTQNQKRMEIPLNGQPRRLALSPDGRTLYVAERLAGTVAAIDTASRQVKHRIRVGRWPIAVAVASKTKRLYVCNQDDHTVSVVDLSLSSPKEIKRIPARREPYCVAVTPDESRVVVSNLLPVGVPTDPTLASEVTILDAKALKVAAQVKLPPGSTAAFGLCLSPDGKWAYVVHGLGRFNLPITQLERGWVNTYALSIIDVPAGRRYVTVLLDDLSQGAANPHSIVCSADGKRLWISHAGVHEVSVVEIGLVHQLLQGNLPKELAELKDGIRPNVWVRIREDRSVMEELENDLTALYIAGAIRRLPSGGIGPKGLALTPDQKKLLVANYYSGNVVVFDTDSYKQIGQISMGPQPKPDAARRGEILFHDATFAFQRWHSCASCHPNQGRVDGLRWDFLRDGIGNPKDTPSLVYMHKTEPLNRRATRKTAAECARTSVTAGHLIVPTEQQVDDLLAYLVSLRPEPSPHLTEDGQLTEAAKRGKALFEGKAHCAGCHPAPYFTDKKMHNVGVLTPNEPDGHYDTPSLIEAYRTAPYLHDGRALTIKDVLIKHDPEGKHGKARKLTEQELNDLIEYILSL
ncbi:MAG: beta-propeller fold lactonase family protein [Planctomycetes bacterium]|nr:beta-propeller fold lactonase family protein [Planctomycetota bacterium]